MRLYVRCLQEMLSWRQLIFLSIDQTIHGTQNALFCLPSCDDNDDDDEDDDDDDDNADDDVDDSEYVDDDNDEGNDDHHDNDVE